jgi:hypothetical protein
MGCFPERTVPRYHSLPNERERLMKGIYSPGKNMDSLFAPINTTADTTGSPRTARPYASPTKKKTTSPSAADPRSNPNSRFKRQQPSLDKSAEKQKRKLGRKQEEDSKPQRM